MIAVVDQRIRSVRDAMTPGQRWTAALALVLAIAVLLFGLPQQTVFRSANAPLTPPGRAASPLVPPSDTRSTAPPAAAPEVAFDAGSGSSGSGTVAVAGPVPAVTDAPSAPEPAADPAPPPPPAAALSGTTALVRPAAQTTLPGRADADMARVFLGDAKVVPLDASATCDALSGTAAVFVAAADIPRELRACLARAGSTVLAHDMAGTDGRALSTRRGLAAALRLIGRPQGRVGVVASTSVRDLVEPLLGGLGAEVVRWVPEGPAAGGEISAGARDFASRGVSAVVFALPSDQQAQWVAQQSVLSPGVRWIVADAFDAGRSESFPPTFDGARLVTTARGPWWTRAHGETPEQAQCRTRWEAGSGRMLASEAPSVYGWCQAAALLQLVKDAADPAAALKKARYASPLTATLGPVGEGWGPVTDAELVWRTVCGCWQPVREFAG